MQEKIDRCVWRKRSIKRKLCIAIPFTAFALASTTVWAQHTTDIVIGQSGGSLALSPTGFIPGSDYNPLFRVDTFLHGWSNANPGFDHARVTAGGVAPLSGTTVRVELEVVALDPALVAFGPNLTYELNSPGDRGLLGGSALHVHLTWFIDEEDPGFLLDLDKCVWEGTFKLVDTGSGLGSSPPFTLLFANVPVRGGEFPPTPTPASGDFDGDHDVDGEDLMAFVVCISGPELRPEPADPFVTTCEVDCYNAFDFDDDLDIDLADFAVFQWVYDP